MIKKKGTKVEVERDRRSFDSKQGRLRNRQKETENGGREMRQTRRARQERGGQVKARVATLLRPQSRGPNKRSKPVAPSCRSSSGGNSSRSKRTWLRTVDKITQFVMQGSVSTKSMNAKRNAASGSRSRSSKRRLPAKHSRLA